jgi:hypothetical protein
MLSRETLEAYRQMTPGQRLEIALEMMRENTSYLLRGRPEIVSRRFERIRQENDAATGICWRRSLARKRRHERPDAIPA